MSLYHDIISKVNQSSTLKELLAFFHVLLLCSLIFGAFFVFDSNAAVWFKYGWLAMIPLIFFLPNILSNTRSISGSLRKKIEEEKLSMCGEKVDTSHFDFETLYNPSLTSIIVIVIAGILINVPAFVHLDWISFSVRVNDADVFNNLIAVHAGIGAVIFALLIFVAESLREDSKERASVLLRESLLFPLAVLEIITFLSLLFFGFQNILAVIPISIVGLLTIYSLYNLIKILLSPYESKVKRLNLLKDRVRRSIGQALNERIGNNILHRILGKDDFPLSTGYFSRSDRRNKVPFKLKKYGIVRDVNLDALRELGDLIERHANSLGLSFFSKKPKSIPATANTAQQITTEVEYYTELKKWDASLTKFYRQRIESEDDIVLSLSKQLVNDDSAFQAQVAELLNQMYDIGKDDNFSEEIKLELEALRDQFVEAVQQAKISQIEYLKGAYLSLVEVFLELINQCGGGYTPEQARAEASAFAFKEGWPEIEWLSDHVRDVYKAAIQTGNKEVVRKIAFLPVSIAIRGIQNNDHFIFQKFIMYLRSFYYEACELDGVNKSMKDDLTDYSLTWLREVCEFHIELDIDEHPEKIQFAFQILIELQDILKQAYERGDLDTFTKGLDVISGLLHRFEPSRDYPNAEHLQWEYDRATDPKIKAELGLRLQERKKLEEAEKNFNDSRKRLFFGFTAWIFKSVRSTGGDDRESKKRFFEQLKSKLPTDVIELTDVFIACHNHDVQDRYRWDWWDLVPNGGVQTIDFPGTTEWLYIFLMLELLTRKTPEEVAAINLNPTRDLAFLAETNSSFRQKVNDLNPINDFLTEAAKDKTTELISLVERAKTAQEEKEKIEIMGRALDTERIEEFYELFSKEYYQHATLRALFKAHGKLDDKSTEDVIEPTTVDMVGYNQIDSKEGFFKGWYVHYVGWGEQYGEGFARSEDGLVYDKITNSLTNKSKISFSALIPTIEEMLGSSKYTNPCLLSPFAYSLEFSKLRSSEKFVPKWNGGENDHKGYDKFSFYIGFIKTKFGQVPVFNIIGSRKKESRDACLVDMSRIGRLIQYPPIKTVEDKVYQKDIFQFKVMDLNIDDAARNKIVTDNPTWLQEKTDGEAYLRSKVLLNIYSKSEVVIDDVSAGTHISFTESEEQLNEY